MINLIYELIKILSSCNLQWAASEKRSNWSRDRSSFKYYKRFLAV